MKDYVVNPVFTFESFENFQEFKGLLESKSIDYEAFEDLFGAEYQIEVYYRFSFEKFKQIYNCIHNLETYRQTFSQALYRAEDAKAKFEASVKDRQDMDAVATLYGDMLTSESIKVQNGKALVKAREMAATAIFG